jgi:outer membrane cobalamin receptor
VNVSKALLRGATLTYDGRFAEWGAGACTLTSSIRATRKTGQTTAIALLVAAEQQMSSYVSRTLGDWELRGEWQLVGNRYEDPANTRPHGWLWPGQSVCRLSPGTRLDVFFARANNIFDKNYETVQRLQHGRFRMPSSAFVTHRSRPACPPVAVPC